MTSKYERRENFGAPRLYIRTHSKLHSLRSVTSSALFPATRTYIAPETAEIYRFELSSSHSSLILLNPMSLQSATPRHLMASVTRCVDTLSVKINTALDPIERISRNCTTAASDCGETFPYLPVSRNSQYFSCYQVFQVPIRHNDAFDSISQILSTFVPHVLLGVKRNRFTFRLARKITVFASYLVFQVPMQLQNNSEH